MIRVPRARIRVGFDASDADASDADDLGATRWVVLDRATQLVLVGRTACGGHLRLVEARNARRLAVGQGPRRPSAAARVGRVALLDCEDAPCLGGSKTYHDALRWDQAGEWQHFRCWEGEFPDEAEIASGAVYAVVVTGSHHSVNDSDRNPWMVRLFEFLRYCIARGDVGVFGVCFGHQAIARALGSRVVPNASGRYRLGVEERSHHERRLHSN